MATTVPNKEEMLSLLKAVMLEAGYNMADNNTAEFLAESGLIRNKFGDRFDSEKKNNALNQALEELRKGEPIYFCNASGETKRMNWSKAGNLQVKNIEPNYTLWKCPRCPAFLTSSKMQF